MNATFKSGKMRGSDEVRWIRRGIRVALLVLLGVIALRGSAAAHGGEDHGDAAPAPAATPGASSNMLTTYAVTEVFELLLKYPPPAVGGDATLRFFLSDYATNRALDGSIELAFSPAGVTIVKPPAMTSPGIFDAVVRFPSDTVYSAVATVRSGRRTDFMELRNIYAGGHAEHFLADHGGGVAASGSSRWPWWGIAAGGLLVAVIAAVLLRKARRGGGGRVATRQEKAIDQREPKEQAR